ncbi:MAG: AraC family transcriptional regulator [Betaproteobacteria bacterium]
MTRLRLREPAVALEPARATHQVVEDGRVRCGIVRAWPQVLDQAGADTDALFAEVGIARALFEDQDNTIPYSDGGRLLRRSVEATGVRHIGILIGQPVTLSAMGAVGFLMRASPTVGHALGILANHFHVHDRGGQVTAEAHGAVAMLGYRITAPGVEAADQIYMIAAAAACNFIRELCGPAWRPVEVQLPFRRPAAVAPLRKVLAGPLTFDADQMSVVFRASDLARPVASADPVLYGMMAERIATLEARLDRDLVGRVRDLMQTLVFLPDARGTIVASRIGMGLRTLNRRLRNHGTTVQAVRDEVRCAAACQLLEYTAKPANEIALILGYADAAAFTRAFRRWRGVPPAKWRAALHRSP